MALNMETNYCGFRCENPFILASSPVSATGEMICRAFEEGWAGAVTKSISFLPECFLFLLQEQKALPAWGISTLLWTSV